MNEKYAHDIRKNEWIAGLKKDIENDIDLSAQRLETFRKGIHKDEELRKYGEVLTDIFAVQRETLFQLHRKNAYSDEEIRKQEYQLDWDELRIKNE